MHTPLCGHVEQFIQPLQKGFGGVHVFLRKNHHVFVRSNPLAHKIHVLTNALVETGAHLLDDAAPYPHKAPLAIPQVVLMGEPVIASPQPAHVSIHIHTVIPSYKCDILAGSMTASKNSLGLLKFPSVSEKRDVRAYRWATTNDLSMSASHAAIAAERDPAHGMENFESKNYTCFN